MKFVIKLRIKEDDKLMTRGIKNSREILQWIRDRKKRIGSKEARLGELARIDLEEEFDGKDIC